MQAARLRNAEGTTVLLLASLLRDPQFCHWQSPTGQRWKETNPPLTIRGPRPYSHLYLKIIVPLHSPSGPGFPYLSQDRVRFRGL